MSVEEKAKAWLDGNIAIELQRKPASAMWLVALLGAYYAAYREGREDLRREWALKPKDTDEK